jgi:hypothetical protein
VDADGNAVRAAAETRVAGRSGPGPLRKQLWFWVLIGLTGGVIFGLVAPDEATKAKWLADAFLQLVKTIAAPVIFVTVVIGIASLGDLARAGALAVRALGYFADHPCVPCTIRRAVSPVVRVTAPREAAAAPGLTVGRPRLRGAAGTA